MQKSLAVATKDLRIFLTDRANLIGLLLIPTVLTIVLGFVGTQAPPTIRVAVIDQDTSAQSASFIADLENIDERFEVSLLDTEISAARQQVVNGNVDALVIIPEGFSDAIENIEPFTLPFYSNETPTSPSAIQPSIAAIVDRFNGSLVAQEIGTSVAENIDVEIDPQTLYDTASNILAQNPVVIDYQVTSVEDDGQQSGFNQSVPGMGTMFVMFTILGGMALFIRERQQWTLQRLIVMPVSRASIIGGKILAYFTLGMIQYIVVFLVGAFFGIDFGGNWIALLLIAMAFSLATTALTFALATFVRTEGQAGQLTTLLGLSLAALGGAWWPLDTVPQFMRTIGHLSPVAWAMDAFQDIIWYNQDITAIIPEIAVLLGITLVLFFIGIANFQYE